MKIDHSAMKLGRHAIKTDNRTLKLATYFSRGLPTPPPECDWTRGTDRWGMMLNDHLGDCTIAAVAHAVQVWSANVSQEITVPDDTVLQYYEQWDGYNPNDPNSNNGGVALEVLKNWQKSAFTRHKLLAFTSAVYGNHEEVRQGIHLFGGVYIGIALPLTAKTQPVWDVVPDAGHAAEPGSWGGHTVFVPRYDPNTYTCITWGQLKPMTLAFWDKYVDDAHVLLSEDWIQQKSAPSGFNLEQLRADLAVIC